MSEYKGPCIEDRLELAEGRIEALVKHTSELQDWRETLDLEDDPPERTLPDPRSVGRAFPGLSGERLPGDPAPKVVPTESGARLESPGEWASRTLLELDRRLLAGWRESLEVKPGVPLKPCPDWVYELCLQAQRRENERARVGKVGA